MVSLEELRQKLEVAQMKIRDFKPQKTFCSGARNDCLRKEIADRRANAQKVAKLRKNVEDIQGQISQEEQIQLLIETEKEQNPTISQQAQKLPLKEIAVIGIVGGLLLG